MIRYFITKTVVTLTLNISIIVIGIFSLRHIANEFIPSVEIPAVAVIFPTTVNQSEKFYNGFLQNLEHTLLTSEGVDRVESQVEFGKSVSVVYFNWNYSPQQALQRTRQIVNGLKKPSGTLDPLFILHRPSLSPIYRVAFKGLPAHEMTKRFQSVQNDLERIDGISEVRLKGASVKQTEIAINPETSAKFGIQGIDVIRAASEVWSTRLLINKDKIPVLLRVDTSDSEKIGALPVLGKGQSVPLKSFSRIRESYKPASISTNEGADATLLEILKRPGSDTLRVVSEVKSQFDEFLKSNPDVTAIGIYDESEEIKNSQEGVLGNFSSGILLNSIILIIFLGSIPGVLIASSIFPASIIGTLFIMKTFGVTINIFSLNGFSLAAGMITDASTVLLESILRRRQNGEDAVDGSVNGTNDVLIGVITGTASSAAVLLPICLQTGISAKLFSDLGVALIGTQVLTLLSVFSLVPFLCSRFLNPKERMWTPIKVVFTGSNFLVQRVVQSVSTVLQKTEKNRRLQLFIPGSVAALSLSSMMFIPKSELLPAVNTTTYLVSVPLDRQVLQTEGEKIKENIQFFLDKENEIEWYVGQLNEDEIHFDLHAKGPLDKEDFKRRLAEKGNIAKSKVLIFPLGPTPPSEAFNYSGLVYIKNSLEDEKKKNFLRSFCSWDGISDCMGANHSQTLKMNLVNDSVDTQRHKLDPLSMALELGARMNPIDLSSLANLFVSAPMNLFFQATGRIVDTPVIGKTTVAMSSLYEKDFGMGNQVVSSMNGIIYEPLYFSVHNTTVGEAADRISDISKELEIASQTVIPMGTIASMNETFGKIQIALLISLLLNFVILFLQFKSLKQVLIVMATIPLSLGGGIAGLNLMNETLNVGVLVGFMLLGGIVVNNGILLMEALNQGLEDGKKFVEAMMASIESRARPIMMTACSTIFGMLPTLLIPSSGSEIYRGMAIVNIFGMMVGTVLSLVVVPVICQIFIREKEAKL